jgi:3-deoxy-D-manno-octulosonate 8-phosphate phosphatase KdsC-like HAD superfamily phosphatase
LLGLILNADALLFDSQVFISPAGEIQHSFNCRDVEALHAVAAKNVKVGSTIRGRMAVE